MAIFILAKISNAAVIKDHRIKDKNSEYEYYTLNGQPARLVLDDTGFAISADGIDCDKGELVRDLTLKLPVQTSPRSDEITEQEFYALCEKLIQETPK